MGSRRDAHSVAAASYGVVATDDRRSRTVAPIGDPVRAPAVALPPGAELAWIDDDLALLSLPIPTAQIPPGLTAAEQEVALAVFDGASNQEIADARGVSVKTVGNQLESIYRKLDVSSRAELVVLLALGRPESD